MKAPRRKPYVPPPATRADVLAKMISLLARHPCAHPPNCGHQRYSECRNALVAAIFAAERGMP